MQFKKEIKVSNPYDKECLLCAKLIESVPARASSIKSSACVIRELMRSDFREISVAFKVRGSWFSWNWIKARSVNKNPAYCPE